MRFKVNESVERIDDIYFTYSVNDLLLLIRRFPNRLIRVVYFPDSEIFATGLVGDYIHWNLQKIAKSNGLTELSFLQGPIHLLAVYLPNIDEIDLEEIAEKKYEYFDEQIEAEEVSDLDSVAGFFLDADYYIKGKDGLAGLEKETLGPTKLIPRNVKRFLNIFN